jgi:hypothetical protein
MADKRFGDGPLGTATHAAAVVLSDDDDISANGFYPRSLFVGTTGDVAVMLVDGSTVTFKNVANAQHLPIAVRRVLATGTAASNIVALW